MTKKKCTKCGKLLPLSSFSFRNLKNNTRHSTCKDCLKLYAKKHYQENREYYLKKALEYKRKYRKIIRDYIKKVKSESACVVCGESCDKCLSFHHLIPSQKSFAIGEAPTIVCSLELLKKEIDKCVVLCMNCHSKFHAGLIKKSALKRNKSKKFKE